MPDEVLTVAEVADMLKVAAKTIYTMAQNAELPCFKVRGQWRFRRQDIDAWIASQMDRPVPAAASKPPSQRGKRKVGKERA